MEKRKVFFLINSIGFGGAERALVNLLSIQSYYAELDVSIVLLDDEPLARPLPSNVKVHQLDAKRSLLFSLLQFHQVLKREKPSLVVSFLVRANVCNALTRIGKHHKVVLCERMHLSSHLNNQFSGVKRAVAGVMPWLSYPNADAVLGVSSGVTKDLIEHFRVSAKKAHTIYNPYDIDGIKAASLEKPEISLPSSFIISVGRLTEAKNFKQLINAYLSSRETSPLCILGEGEQKEELSRFIADKGAEGRVLLLGYAKNPFSVIAKAKYYISASTNEGSAEILEADSDFESDGLHFGKFGILVPMNDETQLTLAINKMQISQIRLNYSTKSKLRASDFHINKIAAEYWQFLKRFI